MLIKSIEIKNFRQFKDIKLEFSTDSNKNVSIISGNNGVGKTTLAEAFTWCLYGEINNTNILLNKEKANELKEGYSTDVIVEIELEHDEVKYTITRNQTFTKNKNGILSSSNKQTKKVFKKLANGRTIPIKEENIEDEIVKILPKDLSKYFFSSGERIDSMGKSLEKGGKNSEFSQAVKSLLGLAPFIEAKDHLIAIQKKYREICDNQHSDDTKIIEVKNGIEKCEKKLKENDKRLEEIEKILETNRKIKEDCTKELFKYEDSKKIEENLNNFEKRKQEQKKIKLNYEKDIINLINKDLLNFMSQYYIKEVVKNLKNYNYEEKDIPNLHSKTIDYLIKRGYCLCGHKIEEGSANLSTSFIVYSVRAKRLSIATIIFSE